MKKKNYYAFTVVEILIGFVVGTTKAKPLSSFLNLFFFISFLQYFLDKLSLLKYPDSKGH